MKAAAAPVERFVRPGTHCNRPLLLARYDFHALALGADTIRRGHGLDLVPFIAGVSHFFSYLSDIKPIAREK